MKKIKIILFVLIAFALTSSVCVMSSCSNADNSGREYFTTYNQTANFSAEAKTDVVTLEFMTGEAEVQQSDFGWVTVTAKPYSGNGYTQVEVKVEENKTDAVRTALQVIKVGRYTVNLTINQGITNIDDPNEEVTDQPAYAPGK